MLDGGVGHVGEDVWDILGGEVGNVGEEGLRHVGDTGRYAGWNRWESLMRMKWEWVRHAGVDECEMLVARGGDMFIGMGSSC